MEKRKKEISPLQSSQTAELIEKTKKVDFSDGFSEPKQENRDNGILGLALYRYDLWAGQFWGLNWSTKRTNDAVVE